MPRQTQLNVPDGVVHVVAALMRKSGKVLLTERLSGKHLAGTWEFPGGKVEKNENPQQALGRELEEEIGIIAGESSFLTRVFHDYSDRKICLDLYELENWQGVAFSCEGQKLGWFDLEAVSALPMPEADIPFLRALQLSSSYSITPETWGEDFLKTLKWQLDEGVRMFQCRYREHSPDRLFLADEAFRICDTAGAKWLVNSQCPGFATLPAHGWHITSKDNVPERPSDNFLIGKSCHSLVEIENAHQQGVDFAVLSPVMPTSSHPGKAGMGWNAFAEICSRRSMPVYALGGVQKEDLDQARKSGAIGLAGIRAFWPSQGT